MAAWRPSLAKIREQKTRVNRGAPSGMPIVPFRRLALRWSSQPGFGQVDIALNSAEGLVADRFFVSERDQCAPFGLQRFTGQLLEVGREQASDTFFMPIPTAQLLDSIEVF